ncbi:DUF4350 domain-containing protein [Candidatus Cyanaurora vandensis]|uniref:DUF4350 domain-containing protein n=1 Tax=Candidatus Cyanaurora vandensis TaxID=2714958 RepID=UPI00257F8C91|nr:DUF4350 domain-containing protein [Candidatus Cyanaurora vandensis]
MPAGFKLVGLLLVVALGGCALLERPYSTHNNGPTGYGAWFALLQKLKLQPERWENRYQILVEGPPGAMLIRVNSKVPLRPDLLRWVRAGNVLIELESPQPLTPTPSDQTLIIPTTLGVHTRSVQVARGEGKGRTAFEERMLTLVESDEEVAASALALGSNPDPRLVIQPLGEGLYIYGTVADLALNRRLQQTGNYQFFANLVLRYRPGADAPVYMDEVLHGYGPQEAPTAAGTPWWGYLLASPLALILVQIVVLLVAVILGANQRLGLPLPAPTRTRASNAEYLEALASTYERAGASRLVLGLLLEDFRQWLSLRLSGLKHLEDSQLITLWNQDPRRSATTPQLQGLLNEGTRTGPLRPGELLARVDLLNRLRNEVQSR